jgi:hypothetical protein
MLRLSKPTIHSWRGDFEPLKVNTQNRQAVHQMVGYPLTVLDGNQPVGLGHVDEDAQ